MIKAERLSRIVARGESSNHSHVVTGDATVRNENGQILIDVHGDDVYIKHLLENEFMSGNEVWTKEHADIALPKGTYEYVPQIEFDPYSDVIRAVRD